jgi:hypothetical protein
MSMKPYEGRCPTCGHIHPSTRSRKAMAVCRAAILSMMACGEHRRDVLQVACTIAHPQADIQDIWDAIEGLMLGFIIDKTKRRGHIDWPDGTDSNAAHNRAAAERTIAGVKWDRAEIEGWAASAAAQIQKAREAALIPPNA